MSKISNVLKLAGALVGLVLVGLFVGWLITSGHLSSTPANNPRPQVSPPQDDTPNATAISAPPKIAPSPPLEVANDTAASATPAPAASSDLITNWGDKLEQILVSPGEESDKAKQLLAMFPHLPPDGQAEIARHLSNLTPDSDYAGLGDYLKNPKMPEAVLDVLLADVLNRPGTLKLPMLLDIARQSDHPKAGEARELLELFLEEDHGKDWAGWETKMQQWLKDNPD
jgi:hypothetical protein